MMEFSVWLEYREEGDVAEAIRRDLESEGYSGLWMDLRGFVRRGDPMDWKKSGGGRFAGSVNNRVFLNARSRKVIFEMVGDKMKASHKKLMKFLLDNGLVDGSWTVDAGGEVGAYRGSQWVMSTDPARPRTVGDAMGADVLSASMGGLVLYHGTTERGWEQMKKNGGLQPLFSGSNRVVGQESGYKHEGNKDHVYLATSPEKAWFYAKQMAESMSSRDSKVAPVLLRVEVPDMARLRTDDDLFSRLFSRAAKRLWDSLPEGEREGLRDSMSMKAGRELDDFWSVKFLMGEESYRRMILGRVGDRGYRAWMASLMRKGQVAYKGRIPLRFLSVVDVPGTL